MAIPLGLNSNSMSETNIGRGIDISTTAQLIIPTSGDDNRLLHGMEPYSFSHEYAEASDPESDFWADKSARPHFSCLTRVVRRRAFANTSPSGDILVTG
jgi:hypothetical protein